MCGCAIFGCDGMCVDALSNMFRILYAPRLVFEVCLVVFVFVTAILIQRSQRSKDDRVILPSWTKATRVHRSNVSLSAFSLDGFAVSVSNWKQVSLRRATLIRRIMACRARVEKGATRSIATGTANVNVGSSQTDMVAEKIESETCRPSTSMYETIWYTVPPESKAHRDIVCVVLRQRRSHLVQGPACLLMCGDCMQDQVASPVFERWCSTRTRFLLRVPLAFSSSLSQTMPSMLDRSDALIETHSPNAQAACKNWCHFCHRSQRVECRTVSRGLLSPLRCISFFARQS